MPKISEDNDTNKMSFEKTITELEGIVAQIEQGQIPLDDSLQQYERGMALIRHCREILEKAEKRIEKISKHQNSE